MIQALRSHSILQQPMGPAGIAVPEVQRNRLSPAQLPLGVTEPVEGSLNSSGAGAQEGLARAKACLLSCRLSSPRTWAGDSALRLEAPCARPEAQRQPAQRLQGCCGEPAEHVSAVNEAPDMLGGELGRFRHSALIAASSGHRIHAGQMCLGAARSNCSHLSRRRRPGGERASRKRLCQPAEPRGGRIDGAPATRPRPRSIGTHPRHCLLAAAVHTGRVNASRAPGTRSSRVPAASLGAPVGQRPSGAPPPRPAPRDSAAALGLRGAVDGAKDRAPTASRAALTVSALSPPFPALRALGARPLLSLTSPSLPLPHISSHLSRHLIMRPPLFSFHLNSTPLVCFSTTCPHFLPRPFPFLCFLFACGPFHNPWRSLCHWLPCKYISLFPLSPSSAPPPVSF